MHRPFLAVICMKMELVLSGGIRREDSFGTIGMWTKVAEHVI